MYISEELAIRVVLSPSDGAGGEEGGGVGAGGGTGEGGGIYIRVTAWMSK